METIIYQGQPIEAQLVNYVDGDGISTATSKEFSGEEQLFRDQASRYYLRQRIDYIDPVGDHEPADLLEASRRTRVHRLNLNAAILWAATRLNNVTLDLRQDAADLLMEGRGYRDPAPTPPMRRVAGKAGQRFVPGGIVVELDGVASAMLRQVWSEGNACREAGEDPRDLVNAAVTFFLSDEDSRRHGQFDLEIGDDALARAKTDRLTREKEAA